MGRRRRQTRSRRGCSPPPPQPQPAHRSEVGEITHGVRLKEVVYTLSPFEQNIMGNYFKEIHHSILYTMKKHIVFAALPFCILPLGAIGWFCADFKEKEKQHHRY